MDNPKRLTINRHTLTHLWIQSVLYVALLALLCPRVLGIRVITRWGLHVFSQRFSGRLSSSRQELLPANLVLDLD